MKIAYFDCFAGISGDMIVGAFLEAGLPIEYLQTELQRLPVSGFHIDTQRVIKNGISASKCDIQLEDDSPHRHLPDIEKIIDESSLSVKVKHDSKGIFYKLAEVEAEIHASTIDTVHFHEVGALDSIIDIIGAAIAMEYFAIEKVYASHVHLGTGFTRSMHGKIPVPAPATVALLKDVPVYSTGIRSELTTPTGAAVLTFYAEHFGSMPEMRITATGYGAGTRDLEIPNLLRVHVGEMTVEGYETDQVLEITTNIDDMNPEFYEYVMDKLFAKGALDVFITPVIMKKNRPGQLLTVLTEERLFSQVTDILFYETTTAGLRIKPVTRRKLRREQQTVSTQYGDIRVKVLKRGDTQYSVSPEYEDCKQAANQYKVPIKVVYDEVKINFTNS